ncbi:MAG: hypothetical protein JOZ31_09790 [Verrucomicrobia bacterium]|nr:hypothetical protein [Verrucomicrobiota bacterium]MBV8486489.1 hypothetical protein [Verrucomicrobiota bacterium]
MITKTFISKSDERVVRVAAKPRVQAPENILPFPNLIGDLLSATKQLREADRSYEVASIIAAIVLSATIVFAVLNYASVLNA